MQPKETFFRHASNQNFKLMKNYLLKLYFICLFISISIISSAQAIQISASKKAKIDSIIKSYYSEDMPGISFILAQNNQIVLQKEIGMADMELNIPLNDKHVLAIGSISKQFTAVAILKLVEQGKIDLKSDIKTYLPDYNTHNEKISVENLLTHTSGISSFTEMQGFDKLYNQDKTKEEIRKSFEDSSLLFKPNTDWSYSNSGYFLLATIIEKVSGQTFESFLQENIFNVAGMKSTYFGSNSKIIKNRARGYDSEGIKSPVNCDYYSWTWPWGAGNILSTPTDMLAWNEALNSSKILKKETLKKAFSNYYLNNGLACNYGYGWTVQKLDNKTIINHGGAIGGYLSDAFRIDEDNIYAIALTNTTELSPSEMLSKILLIVLDKSIENFKPNQVTQDLRSLEGVYEVTHVSGRVIKNSGNDKIYRTITVDSNKIFIQRTGRSKIELQPIKKDLFFVNGGKQQFQFNRDKNGKVISLAAIGYPLQLGPVDLSAKTNLPIPSANAEIKVSVEKLQKYLGSYELAPNFILEFTVVDGKFYTQATGQPKFEVFATTEKNFFLKVVDAKIDFNFDEKGNVISLFLTQGRKMEAKKIK